MAKMIIILVILLLSIKVDACSSKWSNTFGYNTKEYINKKKHLKTKRKYSCRKLKSKVKKISADSIKLWATYYYVPVLNHDLNGIELLDKNENSIGIKLKASDWCTACIEGTVIVTKNNKTHLLNFTGRSKNLQYDCRKCEKYKNYDGYKKTGKVLWQKSNGFGSGVKNYKLIPYKTIAVDKSVIPYGSVIFIAKAKGIKYIDSKGKKQLHDGYFFAADTGSKILGNHIDVFIGTSKINPFKFIKSNKKKTFVATIVHDLNLIKRLKKMHMHNDFKADFYKDIRSY